MGLTKRNYGIDLLRIISMFMIVMLHVLGNGGILSFAQNLTLKGELIWLLEIICVCSVNCFALISGFVGINSRHKFSSLISLCYQVIFYCLLFTGISIIFCLCSGTGIDIKFILKSLLPTVASRYWYFSAYFCLFFFMPLLNHAVEKLSRKYFKTLAIFIFIVGCCFTLIRTNVFNLDNGYSVLWLAILYVFGAYISKYKPFANISALWSMVVFWVCIAITYASRLLIPFVTNAIFGVEQGHLLLFGSYNSPTMLIASIALLNIFSNLNINKGQRLIKLIAPTTFGIYLIHTHPVIYELVIRNRFSFAENSNAIETIFVALSAGVIIFFACFVIDLLRGYLFKLIRIHILVNWTEKVARAIKNWILKLFKADRCDDEPNTDENNQA